METWNEQNRGKRFRLAQTMTLLSRFNTVGSVHSILPAEIDGALRQRFGTPIRLHQEVFGYGISHAFGDPKLKYHLPEDIELPLAIRSDPYAKGRLEVLSRQIIELCLLGRPKRIGGVTLPDTYDLEQSAAISMQYVEEQQATADEIAARNLAKSERADALRGVCFMNIRRPMAEAFAYAGVVPGAFESLGKEGMIGLLHDLPTTDVEYELMLKVFDNPQIKRDAGDLIDVTSLAVAIPYCDVVVADKLWVDLVGRTDLSTRYDTDVLTDVAELGPIMASAQ
jgi:hypothetical protein